MSVSKLLAESVAVLLVLKYVAHIYCVHSGKKVEVKPGEAEWSGAEQNVMKRSLQNKCIRREESVRKQMGA